MSFHKVQWSEDEDELLRQLVSKHGPKKWALIAQSLKPKQAKQCRRRWQNVLNADLKDGEWTAYVRLVFASCPSFPTLLASSCCRTSDVRHTSQKMKERERHTRVIG